MTEQSHETFRYDYLSSRTAEDFATISNYQPSFKNRVILSDLRMVIAPGTLKYPNLYIPQYTEIPSTILQTEGDKYLPGIGSNQTDDYDYMSYQALR